jgi:hypothetical protein
MMKALFRKVMAVRRPVVFRARHLLYGWVFPEIEGGAIFINLSRHGLEDPVMTYLHECLHCIYPDKTEEEIISLTDKVWYSLTSHERFLLSKKLFNRKWKTEEL